jgi:hypothetical protein
MDDCEARHMSVGDPAEDYQVALLLLKTKAVTEFTAHTTTQGGP